MRPWARVAVALLAAACTTPLEQGERHYREGDRLAALETWRAVPEESADYERVQHRIAEVEAEFQRLVQQYKQRARFFEERDRLAESILSYRLALALQRDDRETLDHVQDLARTLARRKAELRTVHAAAVGQGNLASAREAIEALRRLDPIDPDLETRSRQVDAALRTEVERLGRRGRAGLAAGDYAAAERAFRAVLALDPEDESARGYLSYIATVRRAGSRPEEVAADFDPATFPSEAAIRAEGFHQIALAAEHRGDVWTAIRQEQRAVEVYPEHPAASRHLAELRRRNASELEPLIEAGRTAFRNEDLSTALERWRQALLLDPDNERTRAYVARAERQLQNLERLRAEPAE